MTNNPLKTRSGPQHQAINMQSRCDTLNAAKYAIMSSCHWFVRVSEKADGEVMESIECMALPTGTKGWLRENKHKVLDLIRRETGGDQELIEHIYQRTVQAASSPISWNNRD